MTLSHRQAQIVSLVRDYHAATAEWPTDRYLARRLGVSRWTVRGYLEALAHRGLVVSPRSPVRLVDGAGGGAGA